MRRMVPDPQLPHRRALRRPTRDRRAADSIKSHRAETVKCVFCKYKWTAVYPAGTPRLECPHCGRMTPTEGDAHA